MKAGLTADTFLEATSVHRIKERYQDYEFSDELEDKIITESQVPGTYAKLARSIAPEIWGHEGLCRVSHLCVSSLCVAGVRARACEASP